MIFFSIPSAPLQKTKFWSYVIIICEDISTSGSVTRVSCIGFGGENNATEVAMFSGQIIGIPCVNASKVLKAPNLVLSSPRSSQLEYME